jgi:DNA-binding GntR family transcriptional regulator
MHGAPHAIDRLSDMPSRRSQVTDTLRAAIISGELEAEATYSAPVLAKQLGVSATPVREAMMHLANEGLIEIVRNKGFRVLRPTERDLDELMELRLLIEVPTFVKIARHGITTAQEGELRSLARATVDTVAAGDLTAHVAADVAFHTAVLELHGNHQLVDTMRILRHRSRLFGLDAPEKAVYLREAAREHGELVDLLASGKAADVKRLLTRHISQIRRAWRAP